MPCTAFFQSVPKCSPWQHAENAAFDSPMQHCCASSRIAIQVVTYRTHFISIIHSRQYCPWQHDQNVPELKLALQFIAIQTFECSIQNCIVTKAYYPNCTPKKMANCTALRVFHFRIGCTQTMPNVRATALSAAKAKVLTHSSGPQKSPRCTQISPKLRDIRTFQHLLGFLV